MGKKQRTEINRSTAVTPKDTVAHTTRSSGKIKAVPMKKNIKPIRAVAIFQALEGLFALAVASGFLLLLNKDLEDLAVQLIQHAHLNPAAHYPNIFIMAANHIENTRFSLLALGAFAYALFRFVEAYGLFREAAWAELIAAFSSASYLPIEVIAIVHKISLMSVGVLSINIAVVIITVLALVRKRKVKKQNPT